MGGWRPLSSALRGWGGAKAGTVGPPARPIPFPPGWPERWSQAGRRAPLVRHRPGKPRPRHPETPAIGCASMADTARLWGGQRVSAGTHGGHKAFVAVHPSVSETPRDARCQRLPAAAAAASPPQAPYRCGSSSPSSPPPRRGGGWEMECRAWWRREGVVSHGLQLPESTAHSGFAASIVRVGLPLVLLKSPQSEEGGLAFSEAADLASRSAEAPVRFQPLFRIRSRFVSSRDEVRRGRKEEAAA
nr:PREDICTED: uncharacterized protein LOC102122024 [Macaca fascicularis]